MSEGINFNDYLVRNEKYLKENGETDKVCNQEIDANEISIFFSESHFDADNDGVMSEDDFLDWYERNQSAISGFLRDEYSQYNYDSDETKNAMKEAIVSFVEETGADIDISGLTINDEDNDDNSGAKLTDDNATGEDNPVSQPQTLGEHVYKSDMSKYQTLLDDTNACNIGDFKTPEAYFNDGLDKLLSDTEIDNADKIAFLKEAKAKYAGTNIPSFISGYLQSNDSFYINSMQEMINDESYTLDDMINLRNDYYRLRGGDIKESSQYEELLSAQLDVLESKVNNSDDLNKYNNEYKSIEALNNDIQNSDLIDSTEAKIELTDKLMTTLTNKFGSDDENIKDTLKDIATDQLSNIINNCQYRKYSDSEHFDKILSSNGLFSANDIAEIVDKYNKENNGNLFVDMLHINVVFPNKNMDNVYTQYFNSILLAANNGNESALNVAAETIKAMNEKPELIHKGANLTFTSALKNFSKVHPDVYENIAEIFSKLYPDTKLEDYVS